MFMVNVLDEATVHYVLGVLNSNLLKYVWLKQFYDQRTTFPKVKGTYLKKLPVVEFDPKSPSARRIQTCVVDLVGRLKKVPKTASEREQNDRRITALEEEIDDEDFNLYRVGATEVAAVRSFLKASGC